MISRGDFKSRSLATASQFWVAAGVAAGADAAAVTCRDEGALGGSVRASKD